jgi:hypothetical protein
MADGRLNSIGYECPHVVASPEHIDVFFVFLQNVAGGETLWGMVTSV